MPRLQGPHALTLPNARKDHTISSGDGCRVVRYDGINTNMRAGSLHRGNVSSIVIKNNDRGQFRSCRHAVIAACRSIPSQSSLCEPLVTREGLSEWRPLGRSVWSEKPVLRSSSAFAVFRSDPGSRSVGVFSACAPLGGRAPGLATLGSPAHNRLG